MRTTTIRQLSSSSILPLAFCFLLLLIPSAFAFLPGDVNGDGVLSMADAAMIKNHLMEIAPLTSGTLTRADANGDGQVTMADVIYVNTHAIPAPQEVTVTLPGGVPLVLEKIPHGSFQMGSPATERSRHSNEGPVHTVNIGYDYYMGKYLLTQKQYLAVMGSWPDATYNPNTDNCGLGDNYPVYYIFKDDCQNFVTALNTYIALTSQGPANFRLPSEAEWEYACRAGTQTRFYFGDSLSVDDYYYTDGPAGTLPGNRSDYMWWKFNCESNANGVFGCRPVGTKLPNQFGLYDMSGNMLEWCEDSFHASYSGAPTDGSAWGLGPSVLRGGAWCAYASQNRSAFRMTPPDEGFGDPNLFFRNCGMRLAWTH